jgi:hypothetical protein
MAGNNYRDVRERVQRELEDNAALRQAFDANNTAEVGTDPAKRRWYQAQVIDRAIASGEPLANVVNNPNYYPPVTTKATRTTGQGVDESIWGGANVANYATGNSSFDRNTGRWVGFQGGPQTTTYGTGMGTELGGIEGKQGLRFAKVMGYTGPDKTALGPGIGMRGEDGTMLAGAQARPTTGYQEMLH